MIEELNKGSTIAISSLTSLFLANSRIENLKPRVYHYIVLKV